MKKTLLATAIAGALGVSAAAQAATVYDQDGTKVDIYGRIALGIAGGGHEVNAAGNKVKNSAEFVDVYSRLGLRLQHMVSSDLTAFGHLEWRFRADGGDNRFGAFHETRQSYLGLRSDTWGTVQAGNFDSFYNQAVSIVFDRYLDRGLEFAGHPIQSRGDSIGYITPNLSGFQAYLQAKHYSNRGEVVGGDSSETAAQGGVVYTAGDLRLSAGFVDDVVEGGGNDKVLYGANVSYQVTPEFSARLGYEGRGDHNTYGGGFDTWGLGMTYAVNQWAFNADIYDVDYDGASSRTAWAAGAYYNISSAFDVFLELNDRDLPNVDTPQGTASEDMYYLVGARYHF